MDRRSFFGSLIGLGAMPFLPRAKSVVKAPSIRLSRFVTPYYTFTNDTATTIEFSCTANSASSTFTIDASEPNNVRWSNSA